MMKRLVRNSSLKQAVICFGMDKDLPSFVLCTCTLTVREIQIHVLVRVLDLEQFHWPKEKRRNSTCSVSCSPLVNSHQPVTSITDVVTSH